MKMMSISEHLRNGTAEQPDPSSLEELRNTFQRCEARKDEDTEKGILPIRDLYKGPS
jgi:hypothetical protein